MRRLFWLAMGVTIGVLVVRKLSTAAEAMKPEALAQRTGRGAANAVERLQQFAADVRIAMHQREDELRAGVGLDAEPPTTIKEI